MQQTNIQELKLVSPIPPSVNHYMGIRAIMKNGKPLAITYKKPDASKYQKEFAKYVKKEAIRQQWLMSVNKFQHYYMDCVFYFNRTDEDCNNYWKCLADAITESKSVWLDDTQLCERVQAIYYDTKNPRIEITIKPVTDIGIFKDVSQLDDFMSNCFVCKRYKRNCSILRKAKDGWIQEEIQDMVCTKFSHIKES